MLRAITGPLPLGGRILRTACIMLGCVLGITFIILPMDATTQAFLTVAGIVAFLAISRWRSRKATLVLVMLSIMVTARYLFWRASDTLEFDGFFQGFLGTGLLLAEGYAGILLVLAYLQTAYPLERKPIPLPPDPATWPTIDVFIPSYNEALELVRSTVLAALNMDWPRDKMNVWILDDGRRDDFRAFAELCGCGYIIRPDNKGAKAGNINHALKHTNGDFIAIFDCDHAPTRAFLQLTVGWLVRDGNLSMVQTPHHFFSPDPFERNLARESQVPNEGLLFYGIIQQGNDMWNAAFFCGSCAVIRRQALEQIGGVPQATVTEDCHCSFLMQKRGWGTAYLRLPLAAGLATERLGLHIGQRLRWARGMIQIMRLERTPFARGLSVLQRTCYFTSSFSFLFAIPRLVFLTAPLGFLFFGQNIIAASPLAIVAYAGSHMFHTFATTARLNGRNRHSFWSEVYEAVMALPLLPVTLLTLWDPTKGKFNVTDKGGTLDQGFLDLRVVWPNIMLLALLLTGFAVGLVGVFTSNGLEFQAYLFNTIWCGMCLVPVSASVAVGREREQSRVRARVEAEVPAELILPDGSRIKAHSTDLSLSGVRLTLDRVLNVLDGDALALSFTTCGDVIEVPATLLRWDDDQAYLRFNVTDLATEAAIARIFFGRPDAWRHWDDWPKDRPLQSLVGLVRATFGAVFRRYRFVVSKASPHRQPSAPSASPVSNVVPPRSAALPTGVAAPTRTPANAANIMTKRAAVTMLLAGLLQTHSVFAQSSTSPGSPAATAATPPSKPTTHAIAPIGEGTREVKLTLRELGLHGPIQMRGTSDLQGALFGMRGDEVVTAARLSLFGATSPSLIPSLSQITITLNDQAVGTIGVDPARPNFGPVEMELDPLFFTEVNRLNFRFSGRYAVECNDPLSGLLWATVSDLSTLSMQIEKLPQTRDLGHLPEPFFDRRVLHAKLVLPFVIPEAVSPEGLRAAAIAASWFSVQADYRGASFPVSRSIPPRGNALLLAVNNEAPPGVTLPRMDGPALAVLPNPSDPFGSLLVIGGRTEAESATAAIALATGRGGLSGEFAQVRAAQPAARPAYTAPRWLPPDQPVSFGSLIERADLQASGYTPATIRIPVRTAPDLYTWRNGGLPVEIHFRAPPGPVIDVASSRLDVSLSNNFLRSFPLTQERWWLIDWVRRQLGLHSDFMVGLVTLPPYLLLGRDELQMRFDMRPLARGECVATPGDIRAGIDPDSTVDISHARRYARMPNLGFFASAGFPFTRLADLSGTGAVLSERPTTVETGAFLDLVGFLSAITGAPAIGLKVTSANAMQAVTDRDLLIVGALGRQPALTAVLRDGPLQVVNGRLTLSLPDPLQDVRAVFLDAPSSAERTHASVALDGTGEGLGAIIGLENILSPGRSIVAVTGMTPAAVAAAVATLQDPEGGAHVQGDITLVQDGQVSAFRTTSGYDVGNLPPWLWPQRWLGGRPERAILLLLAAACLLGLPLFWMIRRRAAMRLRARTPKTGTLTG
jgi:cellulose synthase (UDP-forming)